MVSKSTPPQPRPPIAGRYQIVRTLSTSAESRVFVAEDIRRSRKLCALKLFRMSDPRAIEAARREFQILRKLRHPGIAEVYDFGLAEREELEAARVPLSGPEDSPTETAAEGRRRRPLYPAWLAPDRRGGTTARHSGESFAFLVSVFYEGLSLREAFTQLFPESGAPRGDDAEDTESWRVFLLAVARICEALEVVHSRGLIHYDLKSDNILLLPEPQTGTPESFSVKILDFGLSEEATTPIGTRLRGTVPFMAPELLESSTADPRSDLFSLGVTLAQAIGGRLPFPGSTPQEWLEAARAGKRLSVDELRADIPPRLVALVDRLLNPHPEERPQSAAEVIRILEEIGDLKWQPQRSTRPSPPPTVGWGRELGRIQTEIEHLKRGEAERSLLLIEGDSDQPMDLVADEVEASARASGVHVETGHSSLPRRFAYQPFAEVACRILRGDGASRPRTRFSPALSLFCPTAHDGQGPEDSLPPLSPRLEVYRFLDLVTEFFLEAARERPLVLCIRDLHLAGKESLDLLRSLTRNVHLRSCGEESEDEGGPVRLLVIGTFRRQEVELEDDVDNPGILEALSELTAEPYALHLPLRKLSLEELPEWIHERLPHLRVDGDTVRRLYEKCGGSVTFLEELVHWLPGAESSLYEQGPARLSGLRPREGEAARRTPRLPDVLLRMPRRAVDASLERIQHLPAEDRHLLEILAVARGSLLLGELEAVEAAGASEERPTSLKGRLERLESLGLITLRPGVSDSQVRVQDPELARRIRMQMPEDLRGPLHARLGLTLLDRYPADGPPRIPEDVAFHADQGGLRPTFFTQALLAARKLKDALALDGAVSMYEKILEHLGALPPDVEIPGGGPEESWAQGRIETLRLEINEKLAEMYGEQGRLQKAIEKLTLVSTARDTVESPGKLASVYRRIGQNYQRSGELANASYFLEKSLEILRGDGGSRDEGTGREELLLTLLAIARLQLLRERVEEAEKTVKRFLEEATGASEKAEALCGAHLIQAEIESRKHHHAESLDANLKALTSARASGSQPLLLDVLCSVGSSYLARGYHDEAVGCYEQALAVAGNLQSKFDMAVCHQGLGTICHNRADQEGALRHFTRSLDLCSRIGDLRGVARSYNNLGLVYRMKDDLGRAAECYRLAIDLFSRINDQVGMAAGMNNLSTILELEGKYDEALEYSFRALDRRKKTRFRSGMAFCYYRIGKIHQSKGDLQKAVTFAERSLQLRKEIGEKMGIAYSRLLLGSLFLSQGKLHEAHRLCSVGLKDFESLENEVGLLIARARLAAVEFSLGRVREARRALEDVYELARESRQQPLIGECLLGLGQIARELGAPAEAEARLVEAEKGFRLSMNRRELADVLLARGALHLDTGEPERAEELIEEAYSLLEELGVRDLVPTYFLLRGRLEKVRRGGDPENARNFLDRGLAEARQVGLPELEARLRYQQGLLDRERGGAGLGTLNLTKAHNCLQELFHALPESLRGSFYRLRERAEVRAQATSSPPPDPSAPGTLQPTESPREVDTPPGGHQIDNFLVVNEVALKVHAVAAAMGRESNLEKLLEAIMDTVLELVGAERGFLILKTGRRDSPTLTIARNVDREEIPSPGQKVSESLSLEVLRTGQPVLSPNAMDDKRFATWESVRSLRLRSVACVPLRFRGRTLGIIYVDHRHRRNAFGMSAMKMLQGFADQAAVAVTNARLIEENRKHALDLEEEKRKTEELNARLKRKVKRRTAQLALVREDLRERQSQLEDRYRYDNIIGKSEAMQEVLELLRRLPATDLPVLIEGESGTGKDLIARAIHFNSGHRSGRFVSESCGALTESLLETELFGHTRGAFTGAVSEKKGLLQLADKGTLFLDDVDDMSLPMQQKLLRFLEEKQVRPVGAKEPVTLDVRILAASSRNLEALSSDGDFRADLFYRLNGVRLRLPPLRERPEDIPLLVERFAREAAERSGDPVRTFHPKAVQALMGHHWPGNVRQLRHVVERTLLVATETIVRAEEVAFDPRLSDPSGPPLTREKLIPAPLEERLQSADSLQAVRDEAEREFLSWALKKSGGKVARAARRCRISRESLYRLLRKHKLRPRG